MSESLTAKVQRTNAPVDRLARQVMQSGTHFEYRPGSQEVVSDMPLPVRKYPTFSLPEHNLAGKTFGQLTAIGMAPDKQVWVVRCTCGLYCHRKAIILKTKSGEELRCSRCDKMQQWRDGFASTGQRSNALRRASVDLYKALAEILKHGVTPKSRQMAIEAMKVADEGRM